MASKKEAMVPTISSIKANLIIAKFSKINNYKTVLYNSLLETVQICNNRQQNPKNRFELSILYNL